MPGPHKIRSYPDERVPIGPRAKTSKVSTQRKGTGKKTGQVVKPVQIVPVRVINSTLQNLPSPDLQQFGVNREIPYDQNNWTRSLQTRDYHVVTVPDGVNFVVTDAVFYALRANPVPGAPLLALDDYQLSGAFTFDLVVSGVARMQLESEPVEINATGPVPLQLPRVSGWSRLNTKFGATRTVPFAIYAEEGQSIEARIKLTNATQIPQFALTKFGCEVSGLTVTSSAFERIWTGNQPKG